MIYSRGSCSELRTAYSRTGFLSVTAIPGIFLSVTAVLGIFLSAVTIYVSDLSGFVGQN
jgi:hypothetical protein